MEFKTGEHLIFPRASQEWIVPHVVEMEALLHQVQAGWGCCRPALLNNEVNYGTPSTSKHV